MAGRDSHKRFIQRWNDELSVAEVGYEQDVNYTEQSDRQQLKTGLEGTANLEQQATDQDSARITVIDVSGTQAVLDAVARVTHANEDFLWLPDSLHSITMVASKSAGAGSESNPPEQQIVINYVGGSDIRNQEFNPTATAQGSAGVTVDLLLDVRPNSRRNVKCRIATFFIAEGSTRAQILTKAETVSGLNPINEWPNWGERTYRFICQSMKVSIRATAQSKAAITAENVVRSWGGGSSTDIDIFLKPITVGPVINDAIGISPNSDTEDADASADASTPVLNDGTSLEVEAIDNVEEASLTATGAVVPTSITATNVTAIPTSGYYGLITPGQILYGRIMYQVKIFDFANL